MESSWAVVTRQLVQRAPSPTSLSTAIGAATEKSRRVSRTDSAGRVHTVIQESSGSGAPASRIQHVIDGSLALAVEFQWLRVDGGWLLVSERLVQYQGAEAILSTTLVVSRHSGSLAFFRHSMNNGVAVAAAIFLPRLAVAQPLHAPATAMSEGEEGGSCYWQFAGLLAAGVTMGIACTATTPFSPFCIASTIIYLAAADSWNDCMLEH